MRDMTDGMDDFPAGHECLDAQHAYARRETCEAIQELGYWRKSYITSIGQLDKRLMSVIRRGIGWTWDAPEAERKPLNAQAERIAKALLTGKDSKPEDAEIADAIGPQASVYRMAREPMIAGRKEVEAEMKRAARTLPVIEWQKSVNGFGEMGLAVIVAEAGDLSNYANPAKLWKRLGLAPYQGKAMSTWRMPSQRERALTADEWTEQGYSGARLGQVYGVVTEPLIKANKDKYRAIYDHEKARKVAAEWTLIHAHKHALRVMTKELILDLWRVWNGYPPRRRECAAGASRSMTPRRCVPPQH